VLQTTVMQSKPRPTPPSSCLLTYREVAKLLHVTGEMVRHYACAHGLPAIQLSPRVVRVREEDLTAWLAARTVHGMEFGDDGV